MSQEFTLMGNNANGIKNKLESLKNNLKQFSPSLITLQETKLKVKGQIKLPGYQIFEQIRKDKSGGGLLTAIDENLDPALITENDQVELLTIQLTIGNLKVKSINAYGPQEVDDTETKLDF